MGFFGSIAKLAGGLLKGGPIGLAGAALGLASAKKAVAPMIYYPPPSPPPVEASQPYALPNYSYTGGGAGGGPMNAFSDPPPLQSAKTAVTYTMKKKAKKSKPAKRAKKAKARKPKFGTPAFRKKYGTGKKKRK